MRTIYVDSEFRCHVTDDGTMTTVETEFFDGKCDAFIEGFCVEPDENGNVQKIYPWKDTNILYAYQEQYERMLEQSGVSAETIEKAEAYDIIRGVSE